MLKKWSKHITEGTTYFGIEVNELDGKEQYSLLKLQQKKEELESVLEKTSEKMDEIMEHLDKKAPIFLTLNTSKVLKKQFAGNTQGNDELLVINAFPNLELDNFYYHILRGKEENLVAIAKKEYVDWYLEQLKKLGLHIFSIALGVVPLESISSFLGGTIKGFDYSVTLTDGVLCSYSALGLNEVQHYDINGLAIGNKHLLSFSHILGYLMGSKGPSNLEAVNVHYANLFKNHRVFDFGLKASLGFFLVLLLANFFLFNHYNTKNETLKNNLASDALRDNSLQKLKIRVQEKEEKLRLLNGSKNSRTTFYFDELGKALPHSIWLGNMVYQPLDMPVRANKPIEKSENNIQITGITNDKVAFTVWSDNLEAQKWVNSVEITDYEYISSSSANFTVNIKLNEAE